MSWNSELEVGFQPRLELAAGTKIFGNLAVQLSAAAPSTRLSFFFSLCIPHGRPGRDYGNSVCPLTLSSYILTDSRSVCRRTGIDNDSDSRQEDDKNLTRQNGAKRKRHVRLWTPPLG